MRYNKLKRCMFRGNTFCLLRYEKKSVFIIYSVVKSGLYSDMSYVLVLLDY